MHVACVHFDVTAVAGGETRTIAVEGILPSALELCFQVARGS